MDLHSHLERFGRRFAELEELLASPDLYSNPQRAQELTREHARLKQALADGQTWAKLRHDLAEAEKMAKNTAEPEMVEMAEEELKTLRPAYQKAEQAVRFAIVPPDENDSRNTIVEIRAGVGGEEAALFAAELARMYTRYAEKVGWKTETLELSPAEKGGVKEIVFQINGTDVYKKMRYESGVHRVQRVPATEAQGRVHTSTATVAVLPEAKEVDVVIRPEDLEITVCRSGGPGGQGVNTTDSAVQVTHKPSGLTVRCQDGRSQLKNKDKALNILRSRLLEKQQQEEEEKYAKHRKSQIGHGDRNEKIRTYNFPQNRLTDHRVNFTAYHLSQVMEGDVDEIFEVLAAHALEEKFRELENGTS
ncbi:MAG: peptide chain release factor 1 [Methylacidiphilales bacterium]|nr:peptide chain release factor 1 [Candidatus Methylacidiphilales bacterium]